MEFYIWVFHCGSMESMAIFLGVTHFFWRMYRLYHTNLKKLNFQLKISWNQNFAFKMSKLKYSFTSSFPVYEYLTGRFYVHSVTSSVRFCHALIVCLLGYHVLLATPPCSILTRTLFSNSNRTLYVEFFFTINYITTFNSLQILITIITKPLSKHNTK